MNEIQKFIDDFINDMQETITEKGYDFCIVVTAGKQYTARPRFIYKTINDFKEKAEKDIKSIDSMFGVDVLLWHFD